MNNMYKKTILIILIQISNLIYSQDLKPSKELIGKWVNSVYEIEVSENYLVFKNKKAKKTKDIILKFLEIPKTNNDNEFESWSITEKFNASVVKEGNIQVKEDLNEYIYFRLKLKKDKLIFEYSNGLYSKNYQDSNIIVPNNVKLILSDNNYFINKIKFKR